MKTGQWGAVKEQNQITVSEVKGVIRKACPVQTPCMKGERGHQYVKVICVRTGEDTCQGGRQWLQGQKPKQDS